MLQVTVLVNALGDGGSRLWLIDLELLGASLCHKILNLKIRSF